MGKWEKAFFVLADVSRLVVPEQFDCVAELLGDEGEPWVVGTDDECDKVGDTLFIGDLGGQKRKGCLVTRCAKPGFKQATAVLLPVVACLAEVEHDCLPCAEKLVNQGEDALAQFGVAGGLAMVGVGYGKLVCFNLGHQVAWHEA